MRRSISLCLITALILCLVGCGKTEVNDTQSDTTGDVVPREEVYAPARTLNTSGGVEVVDDLANTYYKLTTEKKLKVAYFGGSVTQGTGSSDGYCWRTATTAWFKNTFPNADITEINAAWGGKGTYWSYFRIDNAVLSHDPDLVFVEFAINDVYDGRSRMDATLYMEGIVNKIRNKNPNCDIVMIFVTDKSEKRLGKEYDQLLAHKDVAKHYGIPMIDVGRALAEEMERTGNEWAYYVSDYVHPNNTGYKLYADCIEGYLKNWLIKNPNKSGLASHNMPENPLVSNLSVESEIIGVSQLKNTKGFNASKTTDNSASYLGKTIHGTKGAEIELEFTGRSLGIIADGSRYPTIEIMIDGAFARTTGFSESHSEWKLLDNLNCGKHKVKIKVIGSAEIIIGGFLVEK